MRLVSWTWQCVHFTQMASTVTRSQSNRAPLGFGGTEDSYHGWVADKSTTSAWCYHVNNGPQSLRNVSNTLLNLCHEELRQFWRQKAVQPGTSKVYLIKWPMSACMCVCVYIYIYIYIYYFRFSFMQKHWITFCLEVTNTFVMLQNIIFFKNITGTNYVLKYLKIENSYFKLLFLQPCCFWLFWSNKCSLGEHKRLIKKINIKQLYHFQKFLMVVLIKLHYIYQQYFKLDVENCII